MEKLEQPINPIDSTKPQYYSGLTKREYYVGIIASKLDAPNTYVGTKDTIESYKTWANKCILMADVLLKQLNENNGL